MNAEQIYKNYRIPECIAVSQRAPVFNMFLLICLTANLLLLSVNSTSSNAAASCQKLQIRGETNIEGFFASVIP